VAAEHPNAFRRLFRGETSFDFAGRWRRWFAISGTIIVIGLISLGVRGLNFSIDFKGGTVWDVPTSATVSTARAAIGAAVPGFGQSEVQQLTNTETGQRTIEVKAAAKLTGDPQTVANVTDALAKMAHVSTNDVQLNEIGPSWGSDITNKAIEAVIIFLVVVTIYIWLRFEGKMALAALVALVHDILVTVGIYSLSGFQVSPDTVIAFLTILGYSLYDTIVVFDRVQENTRGLASSNRMTYSDTVNLSMNQVLARSLNTSLVAILPILSILVIGAWILGATALDDFGLALFVGLTTGAYSSIFIASPLLAIMKEREPRYAEIRRRLVQSRPRKLTPAAVAEATLSGSVEDFASLDDLDDDGRRPVPVSGREPEALPAEVEYGSSAGAGSATAGGSIPLRRDVPPRAGNRPPPRPRKKGRRR
jgi:preprotein translocase subunit SecF